MYLDINIWLKIPQQMLLMLCFPSVSIGVCKLGLVLWSEAIALGILVG